MSVRQFWGGVFVAVTDPMEFEVTFTAVRQGETVSEKLDPPMSFAGLAREKRRANRLGFDLTYEPLPQKTHYVPGCPWCGVRPEIFEYDCDGLFGTGTCGSPQCNQLKRCETCGKDGIAHIISGFGQQCEVCWALSYSAATGRTAVHDARSKRGGMPSDMEQMRVALLNALEDPQTIRNVAGMFTRGEVLALAEALRLVKADDVAEMWEQENAGSETD